MSDQESECHCLNDVKLILGHLEQLFPKFSTQLRVEVSSGRQNLEKRNDMSKTITGGNGGW